MNDMPPPKARHLTPQDYQTKPWKNGKGQTHDILLHPEGAGHSNFDLRFALSPIVEKGLFSSFPDVDRVITLIEGAGLNLEFKDKAVNLNPYGSLHFDTGLTPIGTPIGGAVQVVNVMARRSAWKIETCKCVSELDLSCSKGGLIFLFAISGNAVFRSQALNKKLNFMKQLLSLPKAILKLIWPITKKSYLPI